MRVPVSADPVSRRTHALRAFFAREQGQALRVVEAVIDVNERQKERMIEKIESAVGGSLEGQDDRHPGPLVQARGPTTCETHRRSTSSAVSGVAEPPPVLSTRSPCPRPRRFFPEVTFCKDAYEACENADAVVIVTEWNQFRMLDLEVVRQIAAKTGGR